MRYLGLIGLAIFIYIVYSIGPGQIIESISKIDLLLFSLALLTLIPSVLIKAYKQGLLVNAFATRLGIAESAKIWLIGFFFSIVTPGRSGNLLKAFYFADRAAISSGKGLAAAIVERIFDVAVLFLFALLGFVMLSFYFVFQFDLGLILLFFAAFLLLVFFFSKKGLVEFLGKPLFRFFVPKRFVRQLRAGFDQFFEGIAVYKARKRLMLKVALLTILSWIVIIVQYYFVVVALQINVSFLYIFAVMPIVNLLSVLPIAFSGIGTRGASLLFFLGLVGATASNAISFSILILLFNLLLGAAGFVFLARGKKVSF